MDGLRRRTDALQPTLVEWRRHLHRMPELGFEEHETSAFVETRLRELDLEVHTGLAGTGVAGVLRARTSRDSAVLLRADMDALPVQEVPGREYGSRVDGRMHACGHDGHMAMMLGAATMLSERRDELVRDVVFCFQPAEEGGGGGQRMIADGVLELAEIRRVFGLHLWSGFEAGTIGVRPGPVMAAQDSFTAVIRGQGGHGALPQDCRDPIVAAALAVTALQGVVARNVDPMQSAVVTVGSIRAGSAGNVIPDEARLSGTMRSFDEKLRNYLRRRVAEVIEASSRAGGCEAAFELEEGYPAVVNSANEVETVRRVAGAVVGSDHLLEPAPMAASEDFAFFLRERPGAFVFVGAGNASRGITAPHHAADFDIDESALWRGTELLARLALEP